MGKFARNLKGQQGSLKKEITEGARTVHSSHVHFLPLARSFGFEDKRAHELADVMRSIAIHIYAGNAVDVREVLQRQYKLDEEQLLKAVEAIEAASQGQPNVRHVRSVFLPPTNTPGTGSNGRG